MFNKKSEGMDLLNGMFGAAEAQRLLDKQVCDFLLNLITYIKNGGKPGMVVCLYDLPTDATPREVFTIENPENDSIADIIREKAATSDRMEVYALDRVTKFGTIEVSKVRACVSSKNKDVTKGV